MTQASCRWPLTAEAWVRFRASPCRAFGRQTCIGTGFSLGSSVFPCKYEGESIIKVNLSMAPNTAILAPDCQ
jgi:hypothetical protein